MNTNKIKLELAQHVLDLIEDGVINEDNVTDLNEVAFHCFNEDYYLTYYNEATKWLQNMEIDTFEGIKLVQEYEKDNFGECRTYSNSIELGNMIVLILGEELIYQDLEEPENIEDFKEQLNDFINN